MPGVGLSRHELGSRLYAWRWLAAFVILSLALARLVPSHAPIGPGVDLLDSAGAWTTSGGMAVARDGAGLAFASGEPGPQTASRILEVAPEADFLHLRGCFTTAFAADSIAVAVVSVADGALDFNRPYRLRSDDGVDAGACLEAHLPRREGDGLAVAQVQHLGPQAVVGLGVLQLRPVVEDGRWLVIRSVMLLLGIFLLVLRFRVYATAADAVAGRLGLLVVAAIIFGCCVSTALKADIFALMTGGRSLPVAQSPEALLEVPFSTGGFSVFTILHAVLFAVAAFLLGRARSGAWLDLVLLGAATETLQFFVPGRGPGVSDMLVDWGGVALGTVLLFALRRRQGESLALQE